MSALLPFPTKRARARAARYYGRNGTPFSENRELDRHRRAVERVARAVRMLTTGDLDRLDQRHPDTVTALLIILNWARELEKAR